MELKLSLIILSSITPLFAAVKYPDLYCLSISYIYP